MLGYIMPTFENGLRIYCRSLQFLAVLHGRDMETREAQDARGVYKYSCTVSLAA
jgi:hypothetical protein